MKQILKLMAQAASGFLVGALCAGLVGFVVFQMLYSPDQAGCDGLFTAVATAFVAILVYPIGATIGTYLAGKLLEKRGSSWLTLLGSASGVLLFFFSLVAFPYLGITLHLVLFMILTPILALFGFYLRGKFKNPMP